MSEEDKEALKHITLADDISEKERTINIDMQIGNDYFFELFLRDQCLLSSGLILQETQLGYILGGMIKTKKQQKAEENARLNGFAWEITNESLEKKNRCGSKKRDQNFRFHI